MRHILMGGILLTGVCGCQSPDQNVVTDVNPARWEHAAEIRMENADTVTLRDASFFLRYDDRFTEDTLTVRIATISPDSLRFEETFLLAIPRIESPAALTAESTIPYRHRLRLTKSGEYRWCVTPIRSVRGVEAVGIHLSKSRH